MGTIIFSLCFILYFFIASFLIKHLSKRYDNEKNKIENEASIKSKQFRRNINDHLLMGYINTLKISRWIFLIFSILIIIKGIYS